MNLISKVNIIEDIWVKCKKCKHIIYSKDLEENFYVCPKCHYHMRLSAKVRLKQVLDKNSFKEMFSEVATKNILNFDGYDEKLENSKQKALIDEAVIVGTGNINNIKIAIGVMDSNFMMGSMGVAVGEKITRLVEFARKNDLPLILFTSSGGARMQEGIFSLMQMAKISAAIAKFKENSGLYITVLTDPTTGGVTASFAMQGDIIISEPKALIGFAGKKVIKDTIKEAIPDNLQTAESQFKKGFIDKIVDRRNIKNYLFDILDINEGIHYNG
ncbi:acetyl-CoA carboxylase carboxyl transferase subunit beta [Clostridium botulinum]|uniref:acetyl-CoA carboxylase, carboxyltransferase subunit beta n=1 Tax=Clostridium botulinum TaxID=1491 RepID=UPI0005193401|nr:acetyl-CoA carboxylase, carboxyltransferase subunit beta [Clostridium botulinum]MBN3346582.1 acetyl-CoA carboxylase carboxyl transferase subunit beta [Clostridium botulinum]